MTLVSSLEWSHGYKLRDRQSGEAGIILELRAEIPLLIWFNPFSNLKMQHPRQLLANSSLTFRSTGGCAIMLIRPVILTAAMETRVAHIHWDGPWNLEWRQWKLHWQVMTAYQNSIGKYSVSMGPKIVLSFYQRLYLDVLLYLLSVSAFMFRNI